MNKIEPDYNYQVTTGGIAYGKAFFQNRKKQTYENGKEEGFREKDKLIKYLEDRIIQLKHHKSKSYSNKLRVQECKYLLESLKSGKYE